MFEKIKERRINTRERKFSISRNMKSEDDLDVYIENEKIKDNIDRKLETDYNRDKKIRIDEERK